MTRVNCINPVELTDAHLLAEIREIGRIFTHIEKYGNQPAKRPAHYTLGTGHVIFWTDKAEYIFGRMLDLLAEHYYRGYRFDFDLDEWQKRFDNLPSWCKNDYTPTPEAMLINRDRIAERINARPDFYKYRGKKL